MKYFKRYADIKALNTGRELTARDYVHIYLRFPPKYSVPMAVGYIKGKSAIKIHKESMGHKGKVTGMHFCAPGYCFSIKGLNEKQIREYVKNQKKLEPEKQLKLNLPDFD